jgi:hypothetical protein
MLVMDSLKEFGLKEISARSKKYWSWTYQFDKKKAHTYCSETVLTSLDIYI